MINWEYDAKNNFLKVEYVNTVNLEQVINFAKDFFESNKSFKTLKILTDARNVRYDNKLIEKSIIENFRNDLFNISSNFVLIKNAFIHTKPTETAISFIYEEFLNSDKYVQKVFNQKEDAIAWLNQET